MAKSACREALQALKASWPGVSWSEYLPLSLSGRWTVQLQLPWCGRKLAWQVIFTTLPPYLAPDFVLQDDESGFQPLLPGGGMSQDSADQLQRLLLLWPSSDSTAVGALFARIVRLLVHAYGDHQLACMAHAPNERLQFEVSTLPHLLPPPAAVDTPLLDLPDQPVSEPDSSRPGIEALLLTSPTAALLSIPVCELELSRVAALTLSYGNQEGTLSAPRPPTPPHNPPPAQGQHAAGNTGGSSSSSAAPAPSSPRPSTPKGGAAAAAAATIGGAGAGDAHGPTPAQIAAEVLRLQHGFKLQVAYPTLPSGPDPSLTLHVPWELQGPGGAPLPALPAWDPHSCLMELVPKVASRLQAVLDVWVTQATLRRQLLITLSSALGAAPLELNPVEGSGLWTLTWEGSLLLLTVECCAPEAAGGGASSGFPALSVSTGGARTSPGAHTQHHVGPTFPEIKPKLTLTQMRSLLGQPGQPALSIAYRDYPWSPRWSVQEMASRIVAFVRAEVPRVLGDKPSTGSTGGLVTLGGPPPAGGKGG